MNRIEKLLQKLCPDGVEFKALGEVCDFRRGSFPQPYGNKEWYGGNAAMPFVQVIDIADNLRLKSKTKQTISALAQPQSVFVPKNTIIVSLQGSIGKVALTQYDSYVDRTIAIFTNLKPYLNQKFLVYLLVLVFQEKSKTARGSTIKTITKEEFKNFQIPIPPLEIQKEIVLILDAFTELQAELQARQKQYEFYREKLLSIEALEKRAEGYGVKMMSLGEVCEKTFKIKWKENKNKEFCYIDLSSVNRDNCKIYETQIITHENAPSRAQQIIKTDDVIFGTTRPTLKRYCLITKEYDGQICSTGFCVLRANQKEVLPKWIFFNLTTNNFYKNIEQYQQGAGYPAISDSDLQKIQIPIPPLKVQNEVVEILDKFDALVNDISQGLPAEITARKKQYEHYREKLLNFKEKA